MFGGREILLQGQLRQIPWTLYFDCVNLKWTEIPLQKLRQAWTVDIWAIAGVFSTLKLLISCLNWALAHVPLCKPIWDFNIFPFQNTAVWSVALTLEWPEFQHCYNGRKRSFWPLDLQLYLNRIWMHSLSLIIHLSIFISHMILIEKSQNKKINN